MAQPHLLQLGAQQLGEQQHRPAVARRPTCSMHGCAWLTINEANQSLNEGKLVFVWYGAKVFAMHLNTKM